MGIWHMEGIVRSPNSRDEIQSRELNLHLPLPVVAMLLTNKLPVDVMWKSYGPCAERIWQILHI